MHHKGSEVAATKAKPPKAATMMNCNSLLIAPVKRCPPCSVRAYCGALNCNKNPGNPALAAHSGREIFAKVTNLAKLWPNHTIVGIDLGWGNARLPQRFV
jgi:hypothetical protein